MPNWLTWGPNGKLSRLCLKLNRIEFWTKYNVLLFLQEDVRSACPFVQKDKQILLTKIPPEYLKIINYHQTILVGHPILSPTQLRHLHYFTMLKHLISIIFSVYLLIMVWSTKISQWNGINCKLIAFYSRW